MARYEHVFGLALLGLLWPLAACAGAEKPVEIAPGVYQAGPCRIDLRARSVEFPAAVNMDAGLIEYALVGKAGKLHESLLKTDVAPSAIQVALLLLGLKGSAPPASAVQGNYAPAGDAVRFCVRWREGAREREAPVEQWIARDGRPAGRIPWVFTGSRVDNGVFLPEVEQSIAAVYHDPAALIDHRAASGASDEHWTVVTNGVLAAGTPVTCIIRAERDQERNDEQKHGQTNLVDRGVRGGPGNGR